MVVYKAHFKVKQYRRDNFQDPLYPYFKLDQIMRELQRQEVHVIYNRIEGLPGNFSIVIVLPMEKACIPMEKLPGPRLKPSLNEILAGSRSYPWLMTCASIFLHRYLW